MEVPLYQLFYDGEEPPELPNLPKRTSADDIAWGSTGKEARYLGRFRRLLGRIEEATGACCSTWRKRWPTASNSCCALPNYSHSIVLGGFELMS